MLTQGPAADGAQGCLPSLLLRYCAQWRQLVAVHILCSSFSNSCVGPSSCKGWPWSCSQVRRWWPSGPASPWVSAVWVPPRIVAWVSLDRAAIEVRPGILASWSPAVSSLGLPGVSWWGVREPPEPVLPLTGCRWKAPQTFLLLCFSKYRPYKENARLSQDPTAIANPAGTRDVVMGLMCHCL